MRRFPIQLPAQFPNEAAGSTTATEQKPDAAAQAAAAAATAAAEKKTADDKAAADAAAAAAGKTGTEGKGAESTAGNTDAAAAAAAKVPDKYDFTLEDAGKVHVSDKDLETLSAIAKKAGWTQDEATAALEEHVATMQAQADAYLAETKADTDYGGEKLEETQRLARLAISNIRPEGHARRESFIKFINKGGAGNNLEVLAFLADIGRSMAEDSAPGGTAGGGTGEKSVEERLYGKK